MDKKIEVSFLYVPDPDLPEDHRYVVSFMDKEEKTAYCEAGKSFSDCLRQIATSMEILTRYKHNDQGR